VKDRTENSKNKDKLNAAILRLEVVRDKVVQKLGSGVTQAQGHVGVLTSIDSDLKVLKELLEDLEPKDTIVPDLTSAIETDPELLDAAKNAVVTIAKEETPEETPTEPEKHKGRGGRPKGSANKPKEQK
jgi:hypothetical protein